MKPDEFRARLDELAAGYTHSQILFTALRAQVFRCLEGPVRAEDVAHELGWQVRGTRKLLDGLVALGLVEKYHEDYCNAPIAAQCLVSGAPGDQTNILLHRAHGWNAWSKLGLAVKNAEPVADMQGMPEEELRAFILGMDDIARDSAVAVMNAVDLSPYRRVMDLGGGPGSYPITFLERHGEMRATLVDRPKVIAIAREQVEKAGLSGRFDFVEGDLVQDPLPRDHDLIFVSNVVHMLSPDENQELIRRCFEVLAPGGLLILKDFFTDRDHAGPPFSLLFAIQMLLHTPGGDTYSEDEVAAWSEAAGFEKGHVVSLTEQTRLWLAKKPRD
jgi:SAM-dependent methyltransferase